MDAPSVRYAESADGVTIAYVDEGAGVPVLYLSPIGHLLHEHETEVAGGSVPSRAQREFMADRYRYIRLDRRGGGASQRGTLDYSFGARVADIEAVLDAAEIDAVVLWGHFGMTPPTVAFAVENPERILRLVLSWPAVKFSDSWVAHPEIAALDAVRGADWRLYAESLAMATGSRGEEIDRYADLFTMSWEQDDWRHWVGGAAQDDVTDRLPAIQCPTLLISAQGDAAEEQARAAAAAIPNAQLSASEPDRFHEVVDQFLRQTGLDSAAHPATGEFRTILFTDVVASTPLLAQLKDARMREVMRDHDAILQAAVDEHGGRVIKTIGDAFMAEFAVPSAAVECAIAMQRGIQAQFADIDVPIRLRIGINAGEPVAEDGDLHGASVVIAKRLESAASENGILVSEVVKQAVAGKDFRFTAQGDFDLKGFDEPVRAWSVEWTE